MVRNSKSSVAKGDEIGLTSCETYHSRPAKVFLKTRERGWYHLSGHFREVVGEVDCFALSRSFWSWGGRSFRHRHRSAMGLIWRNLKRASAISMSQMEGVQSGRVKILPNAASRWETNFQEQDLRTSPNRHSSRQGWTDENFCIWMILDYGSYPDGGPSPDKGVHNYICPWLIRAAPKLEISRWTLEWLLLDKVGCRNECVKRNSSAKLRAKTPRSDPRTRKKKHHQDIPCHTSSHASLARYVACCEDVE